MLVARDIERFDWGELKNARTSCLLGFFTYGPFELTLLTTVPCKHTACNPTRDSATSRRRRSLGHYLCFFNVTSRNWTLRLLFSPHPTSCEDYFITSDDACWKIAQRIDQFQHVYGHWTVRNRNVIFFLPYGRYSVIEGIGDVEFCEVLNIHNSPV